MIVDDSQIHITHRFRGLSLSQLKQMWLTAFQDNCLENVFIDINQNFTTLLCSRF